MAANRDVYTPSDVETLTSDAKKWYLQGVANANKDLDQFSAIVEKIKQGASFNAELKTQLSGLLAPIKEANENTKVLVPRLEGVVDNFHQWAEPPISFLSKGKLKALVWFIHGKRDNKSYYLQNGGGLWCKLRVDNYLQSMSDNPVAQALANDLNALKEDVLYARDMLDDAAQVYVEGINQLNDLICDIGKNEQQIWDVVKHLKEASTKSSGTVLKSAQDAVDAIQTKIDAL